MTGPAAVLSRASPLPAPAAGKPTGGSPAAVDPAASVAFSELFASVRGEVEAPSSKEEADTARDESEETSQLPLPMPLVVLPPEKSPQARFAEELSATLPPAFGYGTIAAAPPAVAPETAAKPAAAAVPPFASALPAPVPPLAPPLAGNASGASAAVPAVAALTSATAAAPDAALAMPSVIPLKAAAAAPRALPERNAAKTLPQSGSTPGLEALAAATGEPDALPVLTGAAASQDQPGQDGERGDTGPGLPALKETKVAVIHQETHFAPAPPQSPAFQIANRILQEFAADPAMAPQSASQDAASAAPVKVLEIQLDPPELGALIIRMSLKDNMLHLQIAAGRHDTMRMIERDQDALSGMLRSAGYSIDGLNVQITTADRGGTAPQQGGGFNPPAGQHSAERQPEGSGSGQASRPGAEPDRTAEHDRETETPDPRERRGGLVYL